MRMRFIVLAGMLTWCSMTAVLAADNALPPSPSVDIPSSNPMALIHPPVSASSDADPVNLGSHALGANSKIHINGFLSAGMSRLSQNESYSIPERGSVRQQYSFDANALFGLQVGAKLSDRISAMVQLVANGDDTDGNQSYRVNDQWAFIHFQYSPQVDFKAGRFRIPLFLYSKTAEVGYSYPWVFLPNELYRVIPFSNMNGFDAGVTRSLGHGLATVRLEAYAGAGTSKYDLYTNQQGPTSAIPYGATATFHEDQILGAAMTVSTGVVTLRANYVHGKLTASLPNLMLPSNVTNPLIDKSSTSAYSFAAKAEYKGVLAVAEYAQRHTPSRLADLRGFYTMLGYRYRKVLPHVTFGHLQTVNQGAIINQPYSELPEAQSTYGFGNDYYVNANVVIKTSINYIHPNKGTWGLLTPKVGQTPHSTWMYGVSLDAIF